MEAAKPLCQMYWFRDVLSDMTDSTAGPSGLDKKTEEMCQVEIIQLQNIWNIYSMTDAGAGQRMPNECKWAHPTHGPMPFTPLGPGSL